MQKIHVRLDASISSELLLSNIEKLLLEKIYFSETPKIDISILEISESEIGIKIFIDICDFKNKECDMEVEFIRDLFKVIKNTFNISPENIASVIHKVGSEHYVTENDHIILEDIFRKDSFNI
ncbi:MAG: hypothetical protein JXM74_11285 [Fusobacteriaceae bacterium]|nr:hypothetical protein [Fusobacteriaceae bacterium]MBN2839328.1 hypothetical protein [Fusobacteriaceae bacterium]